VVLVSILFGFAMSAMGSRCKPLLDVFESLTRAVFGVINIVMRLHRSALLARWFYDRRLWNCLARAAGEARRHVWITCILFVLIVMAALPGSRDQHHQIPSLY